LPLIVFWPSNTVRGEGNYKRTVVNVSKYQTSTHYRTKAGKGCCNGSEDDGTTAYLLDFHQFRNYYKRDISRSAGAEVKHRRLCFSDGRSPLLFYCDCLSSMPPAPFPFPPDVLQRAQGGLQSVFWPARAGENCKYPPWYRSLRFFRSQSVPADSGAGGGSGAQILLSGNMADRPGLRFGHPHLRRQRGDILDTVIFQLLDDCRHLRTLDFTLHQAPQSC
jgi:hypothetical protein